MRQETVIIDFETTGLSPYDSRIIEVGAMIVRDREIVDSFNELMNPGHRIPSFITALTGITNQMVTDKPVPEDVMPSLREFIGERPIIAHNASFDRKFLCAEMKRVDIAVSNPVLCTLLLSRRLIPDVENYRLSTLARHLNIDPDSAHRALADVITTVKLWHHLRDTVRQHIGTEKKLDISIFQKISRKPKKQVKDYLLKLGSDNERTAGQCC